jgi:hypothetical protein
MESKKINQLATELAPALSDLTIIGDPTTGISKKITLSQMASLFTGTVEEYPDVASFPLVGVADTIYIALDTNVLYRWDTTLTSYVELSPNIINSLVFSDANGFDGTISLVGSVATLTITTALTTGSVGFIGASGALLQDNANFFWDDTNNRLGLGTNAPTTAIDIFGSGIIGRVNGTSTNNAFLGFASAGTNKWSIGNVQSDHRFRIYNDETTSELVSVLQTGEFGIGIANPTTKLHIDGGASALIANLDANVSVAKSISFRSDNSNRINLEVSGTESGSNAGANLFIRRYSDAGALIDTPLTITRSTGAITLAGTLTGINSTFTATTGVSLTTNGVAGQWSTRINGNSTTGSSYGLGVYAGTNSSDNSFVVHNYSETQLLVVRGDGKVAIGSGFSLSRNFEVATGSDTYSRISGNRGNGNDLHIGNLEFYNSFSSILAGEIRAITGTGGTQSNSGQLAFYTNNAGTYAERMRIGSTGLITVTGSSQGFAGEGIYFKRTSSLDQGGFINGNAGALNLVATDAQTSNYGVITFKRYNGSSTVESMRITTEGNYDYGGYLVQSSNNGTYRQAFYGALSLMWRGAEDAYINSNHTYSSAGTNVASYTSANGLGRLNLAGGTLEWITYNGSVTAGSAYAMTTRLAIQKNGSITLDGGYLQVNAQLSTYANATHIIQDSNPSDTGSRIVLRVIGGTYSAGSDSSSKMIKFEAGNGTEIGYIIRNGGATISYVSSSDYRLKEDLKEFNGLDLISKIKTYDFKWIGSEHRDYGVIAHELKEIVPNIVSGEKDDIYEETGEIKPQGLDYGKLTPILIKAIQELTERVKQLEAK